MLTSPVELSLVLIALGGAATAVIVLHGRPQPAFGIWLVVLAFVPEWVQAPLRLGLQPSVLVGLGLLLTLIGRGVGRFTLPDGVVTTFFVVIVTGTVTHLISLSTTLFWLTTWGAGYLIGRRFGSVLRSPQMADVVLPVFSLVAILALVESATGWNPFVHIAFPNADYAVWGTLQERAGRVRAEGAFGHSIALGASLALAVPFVLTSRYPAWVRAGSFFLIVGAAAGTLSRTGMLCVLLACALTLLFLPTGVGARLRVTLVVGTLAIGVVLVPRLTSTFAEAGAEASNSADYRGTLLSLVPTMRALGFAAGRSVNSEGRTTFSGHQSIDNAIINLGLLAGLVPMLLLLVGLLALLVTVIRRRGGPACVAVAGQIPALATVALITQYAVLFWFVVGVAVAEVARGRYRAHGGENVGMSDQLQMSGAH